MLAPLLYTYEEKGIPYSQAKDAYLQFFEGAVRFVQNHIAL